MLQAGRPVAPVAAVLLGQRAPGREVVQRLAFPRLVGVEGQLPARRARHPVDHLQRVALGRPGGVAVDAVELAGSALDVGAQLPHPAALGQVGELGDGLDPQVERIGEAPRGRQVGGGLHRLGRRGCMQRIDQHVVRTVAGAGPHREVGQIGEIADAPGVLGADAVELGGQAPGAAGAQPRRQAQPRRRDDQRRAGLVSARAEVHPVVAQRQVGGQYERGLADQPAVEVERGSEVVGLTQPGADRAVLEPDPHVRRIAVGDVDPERGLGAGARDDRRRQRARPVLSVKLQKRCGAVFFGRRPDTECGQDGNHRRRVDRHEVPGPVVVGARHAQPVGQCGQPRFSHVTHLAWSAGSARRKSARPGQPAAPDNSMVSTPAMIRTIPATMTGVSASPNSTLANTATIATPQADHTP